MAHDRFLQRVELMVYGASNHVDFVSYHDLGLMWKVWLGFRKAEIIEIR